MDWEVVIVGMGPVGATLALLLAGEDLNVLVVEREHRPFDKPRAIGIDHESLRLLQSIGVTDEFAPTLGQYCPSEYRSGRGDVLRRIVPMPEPYVLSWPPYATFIQPELERILNERCAASPRITVLRGWIWEGFSQQEDRVRIKLAELDGGNIRTVDCAYLVGCDGARSNVRETAGFPLEDLGFDEPWLVVDVIVNEQARLPETTVQYCDPARPATFIAGPGNLRRWEIKLLPGEDPAAAALADRVWQLLSPWITPDQGSIWRAAAYRFHALVAQAWSKGRVFIAGDAAHQTPPFMAQGLNQGLRDAGNLSWRIAQVLRFGATPAILDGYEAERQPNVRAVIALTKELGHLICESDIARAAERDERMLREMREGRGELVRQDLIPPLSGGLLLSSDDPMGTGAGKMFPQPMVRAQGRQGRLDDVVPARFLLIVEDRWIPAEADIRLAEALGVTFLTFGQSDDPGILELVDATGTAVAWIGRHCVASVLIRPDHIVFGTTKNGQSPQQLLARLGLALGISISRECNDVRKPGHGL